MDDWLSLFFHKFKKVSSSFLKICVKLSRERKFNFYRTYSLWIIKTLITEEFSQYKTRKWFPTRVHYQTIPWITFCLLLFSFKFFQGLFSYIIFIPEHFKCIKTWHFDENFLMFQGVPNWTMLTTSSFLHHQLRCSSLQWKEGEKEGMKGSSIIWIYN